MMFALLVLTMEAIAQGSISGKITDDKGAAVIGAAVAVKNTPQGAISDADGNFRIADVAAGSYTISAGYTGYASMESAVTVGQDEDVVLNMQLKVSSRNIDEVIVTGTFDKRKKMESSIAISTLNANQIAVQQPASAADLLRNVPGVFVNSALGEIRNVVYSRGVSANTTDADRGYYYVSMQEDGLPITNATYSNFGPDYFLRSDVTLNRLEAVRGGSAAITGPNAPGGIFNYLSKTGGDHFAGEARVKMGLQSGKNMYYRADLNLGGKLNKKGDLTYNIGGFYRYDEGFRNAGFPMNYGGQVKANVVKTYKTGSVKFYAKFLRDNNGWFEFLPAVNYNNPQLAPGVDNTDSYLPNGKFAFDLPVTFSEMSRYNPDQLAAVRDIAAGVDWTQRFGSGWTFSNNVKFTSKTNKWNSGASITPIALNNAVFYTQIGAANRFGAYSFYDLAGNQLATVERPNAATMNITQNNLPGQAASPNSLIHTNLLLQEHQVNEVIGQAALNKRIRKMNFTLGTYYAFSNIQRLSGSTGFAMVTPENQPGGIVIKYRDGADGQLYDITNNQGISNMFGNGYATYTADQRQLAGFFGYSWEITDKLNFDGGLRFDNINVKGQNKIGRPNARGNDKTYGGIDGNPLTVYDNRVGTDSLLLLPTAATKGMYDKTINTLSYSAALNYKINNNNALYARYSHGKKAPDLLYYFGASLDYTVSILDPRPQDIQQFEVGFKSRGSRYSASATPFYSVVSNVATAATGLNTDGTYYSTPNVLNSIETYGIELEGDYSFTTHFNVRGGATFQRATAKSWGVWVTGAAGPDDDRVVDYSGNKADNNPDVMLNLTPSYTINKFYSYIGWRFMGNRPANVPNTFTLPSYSQFDLGLGYNFSKSFTLSANVNNILNSQGVMSWTAPGGYPASQDRQGFTPDRLAANPNYTFAIITIPPRSYYLTLSYKF